MKNIKSLHKSLNRIEAYCRTDILGYSSYSKDRNFNDLTTLNVLRKNAVELYKMIDHIIKNDICEECFKVSDIEKQHTCINCWKDAREDHLLQDDLLNSIEEK